MESRAAGDLYPVAIAPPVGDVPNRAACRVGRAIDRARDLSDPRQAGKPGRRQGAYPGDAGLSAWDWLCRRVSAAYQGNGMGVVRAAGPDGTHNRRPAA